jgi:hypothetical protein
MVVDVAPGATGREIAAERVTPNRQRAQFRLVDQVVVVEVLALDEAGQRRVRNVILVKRIVAVPVQAQEFELPGGGVGMGGGAGGDQKCAGKEWFLVHVGIPLQSKRRTLNGPWRVDQAASGRE